MQEHDNDRQTGQAGQGMAGQHGTERTTQSASDQARATGERIRERAGKAARDVKDEAGRRAEGAKSSLADEIDRIAAALHAACEELRPGSTAERTMDWAAEGLEKTAGHVRQRDTGQLLDDLGSYARRNPAIFLGGAALIGFAASRFAKASARHDDGYPHHRAGTDPLSTSSGRPVGTGATPVSAERPIAPSAPTATTTAGGSYQSTQRG